MKVVLLQHVTDLGRKGEVKEVATGYGRNFLIPRGMATEATPEAVAEAEAQRKREEVEATQALENAERAAQELDGQEIEMTAKASDEGRLYAAITAAKIASTLKEKGFDITKDQVGVDQIKEVGQHEITLNLDHGLEAKITLIVNSE